MSKGDKSQNIFDYKAETLDYWKQTIETLQLSMQFDEKYKFIAPTLIEHVLATLQLMIQVKGQYSEDSFIIALSKYAEFQQKNVKKFMTSFVNSFQLLLKGNQEICYFTIMLSPTELVKASSDQFSFYLKLRKYIYANFINERETKVKPMNFDQWVSVVSKQMDNSAISLVGNRIREEADEKSKDKILKNNVRPFDLLIYCYELQSQRLQQQPQQRQLATFSPSQQKDEEVPQKSTVQPVQQQQQQKQKQQKQTDLQAKMKEVVLIHENLASNYNKLANFAQQTQAKLSKALNQIKQGQQLDETEIQDLQNILKFKDFLQTDPELTLRNSGVYEFF
ncbi:unnamed protein product (macronuclear) [Paramecium tetraurelia]|uniref:Cullin family profile domain-containing protein n=1 Tax=Paramecium tetraurelia TaxID=5888 RepID=A0CEL6_PARTE|nr:uncharacterized protein GSPATT00037671001 [Paramecium tetraurelia]CAK69233.1 unnamed protein product [Paramecium tetraurelia]|eukprot:XP_001436630.1 hypothetical protein (macronuclear) [Paramecium tetraurelia strain d4-2]